MLYVTVNEERTVFRAGAPSRAITKDGTIVHKESEGSEGGFRPGMMSLRSMKKHWTLTEFVEMDNKFVHKLKAQDTPYCTKVSLDVKCTTELQNYMRTLDYQRIRYDCDHAPTLHCFWAAYMFILLV